VNETSEEILRNNRCANARYDEAIAAEPIEWIGTPEACARLGVTLRTLYRFIDEGQLPAYKMGRVIRLQAGDIDEFISRARIVPGTLEHLYPDPRGGQSGRTQHHEDIIEHAASTRGHGGTPDVLDLEETHDKDGK
jgi:excisionase family DNA binding protein